MRQVLALVTCLLIVSPILAEDPATPGLRLQDGMIRCFPGNQTDTLSLSECVSFGLITIGDSRAKVFDLMGNPDRLITGVDTAQIGVYPLTPRKNGDDPYLMVTISNEMVTTLALQGRGTTEQFSFSGITLGDSVSLVVDLLGSPDRVIAHKGYNSELWTYGSYPFSFEIENNLVFSIQIWMATETK